MYSELPGIQYPCPEEDVARCLDTQGRWEGGIVYAPQGGDAVYLETILCVYKGKNGRCLGIIEIDNNISDRMMVEQLLRASEAKYRMLVENILDLVGIISTEMHFTYVGNNTHNIIGFTAEEVMRMDVSGILSADSFEVARRTISHQLQIDKEPGQDPARSFLLEVEINTKNGKRELFEIKLTFIRDTGGNPISLLGIGRDITAHKQIERSLRQSEDRYHSFVSNFPGIAFRASS